MSGFWAKVPQNRHLVYISLEFGVLIGEKTSENNDLALIGYLTQDPAALEWVEVPQMR